MICNLGEETCCRISEKFKRIFETEILAVMQTNNFS